MKKEYTPYGKEWETEISKLPKAALIEMLRKAHLERKGWEDIANTNSEQYKLAIDSVHWYAEREKNLWQAFGEFAKAMRWQLTETETDPKK